MMQLIVMEKKHDVCKIEECDKILEDFKKLLLRVKKLINII